MNRVINFSAGPSALPEAVLQQCQKDFVNYQGCGTSVMEMSHRSKEFQAIVDDAQNNLKSLMQIPDTHEVLFLQGGASLQFSMVPLNLAAPGERTLYVNTGAWSKKAISEAKRFTDVSVIASSEDATFNYLPTIDSNAFEQEAAYVHITTNNTIYGTCFHHVPEVKDKVLVADMSSNILGQHYPVEKFGLIYAGAQKNIGPAGLTVVIIRKDLLEKAREDAPVMLKYKTHAENGSMYNTPPCFAIYVAGEVFKWLQQQGGVEQIERVNCKKADLLYDYLDQSKHFSATVKGKERSIMNIPFILGEQQQNERFIKEAQQRGFINLKGHRSVGGMRASIYNAMPLQSVQALVDFMHTFEKTL